MNNDTANAVERVIEESKITPQQMQRTPRAKYSNGACEAALGAVNELSKLGSKDKKIRKRVAVLILWLRSALQEFNLDKDIVMSTWAKRDPETNEMIVVTADNGKEQRVLMRNEIEATLAMNDLLRQPAKGDGEVPQGFTWDELDEHFVTTNNKPAVAPELAARLGPFLTFE